MVGLTPPSRSLSVFVRCLGKLGGPKVHAESTGLSLEFTYPGSEQLLVRFLHITGTARLITWNPSILVDLNRGDSRVTYLVSFCSFFPTVISVHLQHLCLLYHRLSQGRHQQSV